MIKSVCGAVAALMIALAAPQVQAATITLDFASSTYNGADGNPSFSTIDQGVNVTLQASGGNLFKGTGGLGVNSGEADEIDGAELLLTGFSPSQFVHDVRIEKLFIEDCIFIFCNTEVGEYSVNNGAWVGFSAASALDDTGILILSLEQPNVQNLRFRVPEGNLGDEYSVRWVTVEQVAQVPEPASMILLGTGLLGAFRYRRKKH